MPESTSSSKRNKKPTPLTPAPAAPLAPVAEKIGESKEQLSKRAAAFKNRHGRTPTSRSGGRP